MSGVQSRNRVTHSFCAPADALRWRESGRVSCDAPLRASTVARRNRPPVPRNSGARLRDGAAFVRVPLRQLQSEILALPLATLSQLAQRLALAVRVAAAVDARRDSPLRDWVTEQLCLLTAIFPRHHPKSPSEQIMQATAYLRLAHLWWQFGNHRAAHFFFRHAARLWAAIRADDTQRSQQQRAHALECLGDVNVEMIADRAAASAYFSALQCTAPGTAGDLQNVMRKFFLVRGAVTH